MQVEELETLLHVRHDVQEDVGVEQAVHADQLGSCLRHPREEHKYKSAETVYMFDWQNFSI